MDSQVTSKTQFQAKKTSKKRELTVVTFLKKHGLEALENRYKIKTNWHKQYPGLVSLKYTNKSKAGKKSEGLEIINECRGLILNTETDFEVVAFPYKRFYNYGEPQAESIDWDTAKVYEKLDGSIMILYFHNGNWQVASSGTPDAGGGAQRISSLRGLFWDIWKKLDYQLPKNKRLTCMFEMLSPRNTIVVEYKEDDLIFHGARDLDTFEEVEPKSLAKLMGWKCADVFSDLHSLEDIINAAALRHPLEHEGFVVCDASFHRVKVKNKTHVLVGRLNQSQRRAMAGTGDFTVNARTYEIVLNVIRTSESAEFLANLPNEKMKRLHTDLERKYSDLCDTLQDAYETGRHHGKNHTEIVRHAASMKSEKIDDAFEYFSQHSDAKTILALIGISQNSVKTKSIIMSKTPVKPKTSTKTKIQSKAVDFSISSKLNKSKNTGKQKKSKIHTKRSVITDSEDVDKIIADFERQELEKETKAKSRESVQNTKKHKKKKKNKKKRR